MNIRRFFFSAAMILTLLACVVPGFSTTSAPAAKPTADTRLEIMVVETVDAAITQTAQAIPPTSTPTLTPEATSTPLDTPTPPALPPAGSLLTKQENGEAIFTDIRAGYLIHIPENWLAVRVNQQEFFDALTLTELSDPLVHEALTKVRDEDPNILRLFAADIKNETLQGEPVASIQLIWDEKKIISFASDADMQSLADELTKTTSGLEITAMDILLAPNKMQFGAIESETTGSDGAMTIQKRVFFNAQNGSVQALLTIGKSLKETALPAFDTIIDTVSLLNP
ncbi:MAG: hypothetical protein PHQ36_08465 [Anaerolineales bacterium]|nr:hypothetical protein [Anaerolineales bacterium]